MSALAALQPGSLISYAIVFALPALDAIFPVLPSETAVIALGVATAGSTDPRVAVLVACAAVGAFAGDNLSYLLGRRSRRRFVIATAVAGVTWACYSFFIGRLGGQAFQDSPWAGFTVAFGTAIAVSGLTEAIRRIWSRQRVTTQPHRTGAGR